MSLLREDVEADCEGAVVVVVGRDRHENCVKQKWVRTGHENVAVVVGRPQRRDLGARKLWKEACLEAFPGVFPPPGRKQQALSRALFRRQEDARPSKGAPRRCSLEYFRPPKRAAGLVRIVQWPAGEPLPGLRSVMLRAHTLLAGYRANA